jgi:endonuclease/exonuclease/phosphatase family metal-dependent hydrolase
MKRSSRLDFITSPFASAGLVIAGRNAFGKSPIPSNRALLLEGEMFMFIRQKLVVIFIAVNLISYGSTETFADNRDRTVTIMTQNMYLGTDLSEVFAETTFEGVAAEVGEAFLEVQASRVEERISRIADQIAQASPSLIGLQEAALWQTGPAFHSADATDVAYDYLALLLDELSSRGLSYEAVIVKELFEAEVPGFIGPNEALDIRYTDRIAILARTDLDTSQLKLEAVHSGTFALNISFFHPILQEVTVPRGWTAADVKLRGKNYRFINTHLESFEPVVVNLVQALEVLQVPANTSDPVILAGDFNSNAENPADPFYPTYPLLLSGGFLDTWDAVHPNDPGYTWPLFLINPSPGNFTNPNQRIDLVLFRGAITPIGAEIVGEDPVLDVTTPSGFRPSDHAGLVATIVLEP